MKKDGFTKSRPGARALRFLAVAVAAWPAVAMALPPRAQWSASASGGQDGEFPAAAAIDGREDTRWSSPFEDGHHLAVDLGRAAPVAGLRIAWETAFASAYRVETSMDGSAWQVAQRVDTGDGHLDRIYFPTVTARQVRVVIERRATGWGASIWDLDVLGPDAAPHVAGETRFPAGEVAARWHPDTPEAVLELEWPSPESISGLRIEWARAARRDLRWELEDASGAWRTADVLPESEGDFDLLMHDLRTVRRARLAMRADDPADLLINTLSPRGPGEERTSLALYERAAAKAPPGWYPESLHRRQVYWTVVGPPDSTHEALLDEYGNLEVFARGPALMPYLRIGGRLVTPLDATAITQSLAEGQLPLPSVEWQAAGARVRIDAMPDRLDDRDVTLVRYTVTATGDAPLAGDFLLLLRPIQINPKWQHGGVSPIHRVLIRPAADATRVEVDGWGYTLTPPADAALAAPHAGGDVVHAAARGRWSGVAGVDDPSGMISVASRHTVDLSPGASTSVVLTVGGTAAVDSAEFAARREAAEDVWRGRVRRAGIALGDREVTDTLYAQAGYILVNRDGVALQPGSRNYNRVWIRDGSLTASALLRLGLVEEAVDYVDWYARAVREDGLVPPILDNDGTVHDGFGSNLEYDAQGQFIFIVAETARFTGNDAFLRRHYPAVLRAMRCMQALREQTLEDDYAADDPRRARYRGLLPASISHEGYNTPHHSYWDDYWALRGWRDGAELARRMGEEETAAWADEQYALLAASVRASLALTMSECGIDFIPGSAERGDPDATSVSIAFFPCEVADDVFTPEAIAKTYDDYLAHVARRDAADAAWLYTPYEARNIAALQVMGRIDDARALHDRLFRDRRPPGWRHYAEVVTSDPRRGTYIGDMPHTWVGADYVVSVRTMLVREAGDDLWLLEGAPAAWWNGGGFSLEALPTRFGPLDLRIERSAEGYGVSVKSPPRLTGRIRLHLPAETTIARMEVDGRAVAASARDPAGYYEWSHGTEPP